ncbi:hypothetical protein VTN96DRAFT_10119 [Rasamsonia emersonii]
MYFSLWKIIGLSDTESLVGLLHHQATQLRLGIMISTVRVRFPCVISALMLRLIRLGTIRVSDEVWFSRLISHAVSGREDAFRDGVRARDGKCVISGEVNDGATWGVWAGFQAAHVFPLEHENLWIQYNYGRWITKMDDVVGNSKINSVQNGLLMSENLHTRFDQYLFSINPVDGYKVITFMPNRWGIDGRILDPICRNPNNPDHVSDEVLRWHFRQCILANMRGAGEPVFETDFPAGTDMMATLRAEPYGKERFEMELASRLRFMAGAGED